MENFRVCPYCLLSPTGNYSRDSESRNRGAPKRGLVSPSYQTKPAICKLIQEVFLDINELTDTKAMVDKDHLTHMLDIGHGVQVGHPAEGLDDHKDTHCGGQEGEADLF